MPTALFRYHRYSGDPKWYLWLLVVIMATACVISPYYIWLLWSKRHDEDAEPSDAVLIVIRIVGIVVWLLTWGLVIFGNSK